MLPTINTAAALHDPLMENTYTRVVYLVPIIFYFNILLHIYLCTHTNIYIYKQKTLCAKNRVVFDENVPFFKKGCFLAQKS